MIFLIGLIAFAIICAVIFISSLFFPKKGDFKNFVKSNKNMMAKFLCLGFLIFVYYTNVVPFLEKGRYQAIRKEWKTSQDQIVIYDTTTGDIKTTY